MKNITIIGIDYSIKSPAVSVLKDNCLQHFIYPRKDILKEDFILSIKEAGIFVKEIDDFKKFQNLQENERINSKDSEILSLTLCNSIKKYFNKNTYFVIEGLSFAAPGNTKIQHAGYHYILRHTIKNFFNIDYSDIFVYAPTSLKMTAGKGNFNKDAMITAFVNSKDSDIISSKLYSYLNDPSTVDNFKSPRAKNWLKPLDDIIDSVWVIKTFQVRNLNETN